MEGKEIGWESSVFYTVFVVGDHKNKIVASWMSTSVLNQVLVPSLIALRDGCYFWKPSDSD